MNNRLEAILSKDTFDILMSVKDKEIDDRIDEAKKPVIHKKTILYKPIDRSWTIMDLFLYRVPVGWESVFSTIAPSVEYISREIEELEKKKQSILPSKDELLTAFDMCSLKDIKVLILGQDPYHSVSENGIPDATGMSFSCRRTEKTRPALKVIFKELQRSYGDKYLFPEHGDLTKWAKQGVFLLNSALTVLKKTPGKHIELWKEFTIQLIQIISKLNKKIIFVFWGSEARKFGGYIKNSLAVLEAAHPAAGFHGREVNNPIVGSNHFVKINRLLRENGRSQIEWNTSDDTDETHVTIVHKKRKKSK